MNTRVAVAGLDKEIVELVLLAPGLTCIGVFDEVDVGETLGCPWLGTDSEWAQLRMRHPGARIIVGVDVPLVRQKLIDLFGRSAVIGIRAESARISRFADVSNTAIVQSGVTIHADATVGPGCKINHDAVIHHDCSVGEFSTIAPGARLLGNVCLEDSVFVGAAAIVMPHVSVGRGAIIGAGAVVTKDIESGLTVAGNPARRLVH